MLSFKWIYLHMHICLLYSVKSTAYPLDGYCTYVYYVHYVQCT